MIIKYLWKKPNLYSRIC